MKMPNLYLRRAGTSSNSPPAGTVSDLPRGVGRPRADSGAGDVLEKKSVLLGRRDVQYAERLGGGNLSLGLRKLISMQRGGLPPATGHGRIESEFEIDFNQE